MSPDLKDEIIVQQKLKVLRLAHQACRDPTLAGGKGSNLAKLSGLQDTVSEKIV